MFKILDLEIFCTIWISRQGRDHWASSQLLTHCMLFLLSTKKLFHKIEKVRIFFIVPWEKEPLPLLLQQFQDRDFQEYRAVQCNGIKVLCQKNDLADDKKDLTSYLKLDELMSTQYSVEFKVDYMAYSYKTKELKSTNSL